MATTFTIPGEPEAWKRAKSNGARRFTDPRHKAAKDAVALVARAAFNEPIEYEKPVVMRMDCYMKPPKRINYTKRPYPLKKDVDNLAKLVMDALNRVAYEDDRQVIDLTVAKYWAKDGNPRTEITVREMEVG